VPQCLKLWKLSSYCLVFSFFLSGSVSSNEQQNIANTNKESFFQEVTTLANSGIVPGEKKYGADGISVAKNGDVYVSSGPLSKGIIKITPRGVVSEFATGFKSANGSDFDSIGNLFVADYASNAVKRVTPDGEVSIFADNLDGPAGVYVDHDDNVIVGLYGSNFSGKGRTVLRISPDGKQSVLATGNGLKDVIGVVGDENGEIYAGNYKGGELFRLIDGKLKLLAKVSVKVNMIDYSQGYIYIANDSRIVRVNTSTGQEESFSGTSESTTKDGPIASADYVMPTALAFSEDESILYVVDQTTGDVRKISKGQ